MHKDQAMQRELNGLIKAAESPEAQKLQIITYNEEDSLNYKGYDIEIVPAWKWALLN
ncbi:MAG: hypothetical protein U5Q03_15315 [Bacteroidota bacterium]|nr:hypothetical protein [Bacteroidota bacterium]